MKKILFNFIFLFLVITLNSQWIQTNGPIGGYNTALLYYNSNLYAGTDGQGIFISSNNGQSWIQAAQNDPNICLSTINCFALQGNYIYAGTFGSGLYLSTNNGQNWSQVSGLITINALAINGINIYAGTDNGIYLSTNHGQTFNPTSLNNNVVVWSIATSSMYVYAGTQNGLYFSSDNGQTWKQSNPTPRIDYIYSLAINGSTVFAGTGFEGILKSTNNGLSWMSSLNNSQVITCLTVNGGIIYAGSNTVYISSDNGQSWIPTTSIQGGVGAIAINSTNIFAGGDGVFLSSNNGLSWISTPFINHSVNTLLSNGQVILAGTNYGLYLTSNSGNIWNETNLNYNNTINCIAQNGTSLISGTWFGVYLSTNSGLNWIQSGLSNKVVYALNFNGQNFFAGTNNGLYLSTNDGQSWNQINPNIGGVGFLLSNGSNVYAGSANKIYFSSDNGQSWVQNTIINNYNITSLCLNGTLVFAGTLNGLYVSSNNGQNWTQTLPQSQVQSILVYGTNDIFAGYPGGVYFSSNNGSSWNQVNDGLGNKSILSLMISNNYIYAGTKGYSVWKRYLPEIIGVKNIGGEIPKNYNLYQNYPNPFNPITNIKYQIANNNNVNLTVYDILGREIGVLVNEKQNAGTYEVTWDGSNYSSGVYFYKLSTGDYTETKKMLLIK